MPGRARLTRRFRLTSAALLASVSLGAGAEDLMQVFREAQGYDAVYAAARYNLEAGRERRDDFRYRPFIVDDRFHTFRHGLPAAAGGSGRAPARGTTRSYRSRCR